MALAAAAAAATAAAAASPARCCVRASDCVGPRCPALAVPLWRAPEHSRSAAPPNSCRSGVGEAKTEASVGRRQALGACFQIAGVAALEAALRALPASAGEAVSSSAKTTNLSIDQIKTISERDISEGQYFVTGNLTRGIYRDDCRFKDPTNETVGLDKYLQAVGILFDPRVSKQELRAIRVTGPDTIDADWTLGGYLKLPWRPHVLPFQGSTMYKVDGNGLVALHSETWEISPITALLETITPSWGPAT